MSLRLAIVGDVHGCWVDADTEYFNGAGYDALLFVGDLAPLIGPLPTARRLAALRTPAFLIPGNHDGASALQFLAELKHRTSLAALLSFGQGQRESALRQAIGAVKLVGYSLDLLTWDRKPLGLLAARPYSMGGDRFYFQRYLQRHFDVANFEESATKLRALIDTAPRDLIFLSHNGPAGLGSARDDIWGCDFRAGGGDFGDPDLRAAIEYAGSTGRIVHAVIAGHMHHRLKGGGQRRSWQTTRDGIVYVNAARVPRIRRRDQLRHHVALTLDERGAHAEAVWINARGETCNVPD